MVRIVSVAAAVLAVGMLAGTSQGSITFSSATRTLRAVAANTSEPAVTDSVTGLAPYNNSISSQNPTINEPLGTFQQASASQQSSFGPDSVAFSGSVFGQDNAVSSGAGNCVGTSTLTLLFSVDTPTAWSAAYTIGLAPAPHSATDVFGASCTIRNAANVNVPGFDGTLAPSPQSGVLAPGSYTLTLTMTAGHGFTGTGAVGLNYDWAVNFGVPAPAAAALLGLSTLTLARRRR